MTTNGWIYDELSQLVSPQRKDKITNRRSGTPNMYALLIGVDCYLPNRLPGGSYYSSLGGCVLDILQVEAFLQRTFQMPTKNIVKLPPPTPVHKSVLSRASCGLPTRIWWPHSSGCPMWLNLATTSMSTTLATGGASTMIPELKGENGLDEALVPTDIGNTEARYLRDVELAKILNDMVDQGLIVAVVLDSCHSGGMTRGRGNVAVRGISLVDTTSRRTQSLVGSHQELAELWDRLTQGTTRNVVLGGGWLPEPQGYVLLAACRSSESAYEYVFEGGTAPSRTGCWTHCMTSQDLYPRLLPVTPEAL